MSSIKKEIFIASRFEEFKNLRATLSSKINTYNFMEAVDLNDNQASHRSPLDESLFHARKSEVMILLVGETYGTVPEGKSKSYTNLEYEEANKESSNTRILVICIGESYGGKHIKYSQDPKMKDWQIKLEKDHRLSKFNQDSNEDEIVEQIMVMLLTSIYELNPTEDLDIPHDTELYLDALADEDDESFLENEDVSFLDNQKSEIDGIEFIDTREYTVEGFDLLKIPGKLAALEQKEEAKNAIELKDYYTASKHLKKALDLRPLDFESNYWLAKLYVASAKKNLFYDIEEYLLRAAKIAQQEKNIFKASHCYQLIIQASIFSDKENEGLKYIQLAEELTPNYARVYYEKAKFMFFYGYNDRAEKSLVQAINIRIDILKEIAHDPFFIQYRKTINEVKQNFKEGLTRSCYAISSNFNKIKKNLDIETNKIDINNLSIYMLWKKSRYNFFAQYRLISKCIMSTDQNQILNVEKKIQELDEQYNRDLLYGDKSLDNDIIQLDSKYENKISSIKSSYSKLSDYKLYSFLAAIVAIIGFVIILSSSSMERILLLIPFGFLIILTILIYTGNILNKKQQDEFKNALTELDYARRSANIKYEENKNILKKGLQVAKENCLEEINSFKTLYQNIEKAFKIFEEETVHKTTSKLVPFKSLNSSHVGSIVRVTPGAYKKSSYTIDIINVFPSYLNIGPLNPDENSFLGKVIKKDRDNIIISRYQAYDERNFEEAIPKKESLKQEKNSDLMNIKNKYGQNITIAKGYGSIR